MPFLNPDNNWAILLAATSNESANDFEFSGEEPLYLQVMKKSMQWGSIDNTMFVVGATRPQMFESIRKICPNHFFLVPGVGAQGGSLQEVVKYGMNSHCGLLINSSRGIIYAERGNDFAEAAGKAAHALAEEMAAYLV
jgi:orotidine-5'-phosphate decarboxylase